MDRKEWIEVETMRHRDGIIIGKNRTLIRKESITMVIDNDKNTSRIVVCDDIDATLLCNISYEDLQIELFR